ncbi:hypothetical protein [Oceanomicrobium pacificus]|uniref:Uncharacterized protein n=1 Tax=Oceanomicrobium pacificus TaxID=2692916 RepID=A0A6B0TTG8_9RHOB|nr:hypothetical protein [Oceanomicrobium pacificus]MXU66069.1 hypothetical protein [Oceanomicrobium pacificus]
MSYGVGTVNVHKKLKLDKRNGSDNWYARLTLENGKRIVKSTKTDDLEEAKERALELYFETQARIKTSFPPKPASSSMSRNTQSRGCKMS